MTGIGLYHPKHAVNIGSVLRAAECFDADYVAIEGKRYRRAGSDVFRSYKRIPVLHTTSLHAGVPFDCVPVAVEFVDNTLCWNLFHYKHPENAFYIFGPEDSSLGKSVYSWCRDIVYIPTTKCLNLAMTVNIVLYDRRMKEEYK